MADRPMPRNRSADGESGDDAPASAGIGEPAVFVGPHGLDAFRAE